MRAELQTIVDALLAASEDTREVTLDALGEAVGTRAITSIEVDAMITALERAGRDVTGPGGGAGEDRLKIVVATARLLARELGKTATVVEIAARSGLSVEHVRHALALAKFMQR